MIPYVRDFAFEYGRADLVSPLIRRVVAENPGPFTFTGTGTYIVGSPEPGSEVAVIDPGPEDPRHLAALQDALAGQRLTHILLTHSHLDHSPLARPLQAALGGALYGRGAPEAAPLTGEEGEDARFTPDVELAGGQLLSGPDWTLETIATPGHASNHLAFALHEENALFSGDHVMGWSTTVISPPDGDMGDYLASLDRVIAGGFSTIWPAHGPPVTDVAPFLQAYRAHRLEREAQILDALARGRTRITDMVPELYAGVDRALWPAAARSVWAHLIHLVRTGRARSDSGEATLDAVYAPRTPDGGFPRSGSRARNWRPGPTRPPG